MRLLLFSRSPFPSFRSSMMHAYLLRHVTHLSTFGYRAGFNSLLLLPHFLGGGGNVKSTLLRPTDSLSVEWHHFCSLASLGSLGSVSVCRIPQRERTSASGGDFSRRSLISIPTLREPCLLCITEGEIKVCTWLREISSCSCLTVLPGPAWLLLNKICILFLGPLYTVQRNKA